MSPLMNCIIDGRISVNHLLVCPWWYACGVWIHEARETGAKGEALSRLKTEVFETSNPDLRPPGPARRARRIENGLNERIGADPPCSPFHGLSETGLGVFDLKRRL